LIKIDLLLQSAMDYNCDMESVAYVYAKLIINDTCKSNTQNEIYTKTNNDTKNNDTIHIDTINNKKNTWWNKLWIN